MGTARRIALFALTGLLGLVLVNGSARADDAPPLTAAQVIADPAVAALQEQMTTILAGDFQAAYVQKRGTTTKERADYERRKEVDRVVATAGKRSIVVIGKGPITCGRTVSRSRPADLAGDKAARWSCDFSTTATQTVLRDLRMQTPVNAMRTLRPSNVEVFSVTAADGRVTIGGLAADGTPTINYDYTLTPGSVALHVSAAG
jgi:hypothetical protein